MLSLVLVIAVHEALPKVFDEMRSRIKSTFVLVRGTSHIHHDNSPSLNCRRNKRLRNTPNRPPNPLNLPPRPFHFSPHPNPKLRIPLTLQHHILIPQHLQVSLHKLSLLLHNPLHLILQLVRNAAEALFCIPLKTFEDRFVAEPVCD